MSPLHFVIMLIVAIIILTVLTLKFKMHPVMVLFLTATFCGLASGKTLVDTFAAITKYFGSTLGSIGVMIIFGAVIASGINDTGAATSMVNFFIKKFKGKCLELAPSLTGFISGAATIKSGSCCSGADTHNFEESSSVYMLILFFHMFLLLGCVI